MSSSPWERLRNGDEDVASPFRGEDRGLGVQGGQDEQDDRMVTNHEVCGGDPVHPDILSKTDS
jgi:hypothetical protein